MSLNKQRSPRDFLEDAIATVDQRGTDNGYDVGQERSAAKIAAVFNMLTGHKLTEADAWTFLIVLKLVRNGRKYKVDNIVDLAGYTALLGECLNDAELARQIVADAGQVISSDPLRGFHQHTGPASASGRTSAPDAKLDVRPNVSLALATGQQIDAYGAMIHTPRVMRTVDEVPPCHLPQTVPETDQQYRERIIETARQADLCLHPIFKPHEGGFVCEKCGDRIGVEAVSPLACPRCGMDSYEDLGGNYYRCCDCAEHFTLSQGLHGMTK